MEKPEEDYQSTLGVSADDFPIYAAAPDLLAALRKAREFIVSDYTGSGGRDLSNGALAEIDAAIAKAEGSK